MLAIHLVSMLLCQLLRGLICCTMADLTSSLSVKVSAKSSIGMMPSCCNRNGAATFLWTGPIFLE